MSRTRGIFVVTFLEYRSVWAISVLLFILCGCQGGPQTKHAGNNVVVAGRVTKLERGGEGNFRYYGEFILHTPERYRGRQVGLFILAHEVDARKFVGRDISFTMSDDDVTRSVEPHPDPFSAVQPKPQFGLEYADGAFRPIDNLAYERSISVRGVVRRYEPKTSEDVLYFQWDMGYSGDMASVEITEPARYRGAIVHVLVYANPKASPALLAKWRQIGTGVTFSVTESVPAWEPWGFTPIEQLQAVQFEAAVTQIRGREDDRDRSSPARVRVCACRRAEGWRRCLRRGSARR